MTVQLGTYTYNFDNTATITMYINDNVNNTINQLKDWGFNFETKNNKTENYTAKVNKETLICNIGASPLADLYDIVNYVLKYMINSKER